MNGYAAATMLARANGIEAVAALVNADGSAAQGYARSDALRFGPDAARNAADAIHFLCILHARHPGVIDHAIDRDYDGSARDGLMMLRGWFRDERALLTRLVVAVGPMPSTPGQSQSDAAILTLHQAIETLARSERRGCALGTAIALALDWAAIRPWLELAASRLNIGLPEEALPHVGVIRAGFSGFDAQPPLDRAMAFGAQQLIAQHRAMWDLLEARSAARSGT